MKRLIVRFFVSLIFLALSACSSIATKAGDGVLSTQTVDKILVARGYAKEKNLPELTQIQNRFANEQAARLNAYRELAKQLYSEKLVDNLTVADQVIKNEQFRIYVDLYLREATVVESGQIADLQKAVLSLNLTPRFYQCVSSSVRKASQCMQEDNKVAFTRIGYQKANRSTVDLSCVSLNCSPQMSIAGFSNKPSALDNFSLNYGMYDASWTANMAFKTMLHYLYLTAIVFD